VPLYTLQCLQHHPEFNSRENSVFSESQCLKCAICIGERFTLCNSHRFLYGFWVADGTFLRYSKYLSTLTKTPCGHRRGADDVYLKKLPSSATLLKRKRVVNIRVFQTSKTNHSPYAYCANAMLWQRTDCFIWEVRDSKYWHMVWTEYFLKQTLIFESNKKINQPSIKIRLPIQSSIQLFGQPIKSEN